MNLARIHVMTIRQQVVQYGQRRIARRMLRAAPWLGSIVALATLGAAIRRKGALRGTADTVLDFIPFVGGMKNAVEIARGRDLLRDRPKAYDEVAR
jgi:hypothetical protein